MSVIIILLVVSVCIAAAFLLAFLWSVNDGQFEDEFSAANRILFDESLANNQSTK
ncbi:MAG: cbb3-type cytochrome oxidase assembly protein CcoS [Chitinophagales bacterium]